MSVALARRRASYRSVGDAVDALWTHLRGRRLAGFKFRRQHPCGPFVLDFFCPARRLAIEVEGGQQEPDSERYEAWRTEFIAARGIRMLRFSNDQIFRKREAVLLAIVFALDGHFPD
jgi:very-short-patch-repair endonuclease